MSLVHNAAPGTLGLIHWQRPFKKGVTVQGDQEGADVLGELVSDRIFSS